MLELMNSNVIISEVDAVVYVILIKEEKHGPCEELIGSTECMML
jgi:hypothetical protein